MPTLGTEHNNNLALSLRFRFNGTDVSWGQPYRINSFSNSAESVDGKYRISDLDVQFPDTNGSIFATAFGNGTSGFGTSCQVIAYLGGTADYVVHGYSTMFESVGTAGAVTATIHTGNIHSISYGNRLLRIRSKTKMGQLNDLAWRRPIPRTQGVYTLDAIYGTYAFVDGNVMDSSFATNLWGAYTHLENNNTKWKALAYLISDPNISSSYATLSNRGTPAGLNDNAADYWCFPGTSGLGTNFYDVYTPVQLEATYLGTYEGTIETTDKAREYGFRDLSAANAALVGTNQYPINKTRYKRASGTFETNATNVYTVGSLRIKGSPKEVYENILTYSCVTPLFSSSDLDTTSLNQTATVTTYSYYDRIIPWEEEDALDALKDLLQSTHALFCLNALNKFEYRAYGPVNLHQTLESWGTGSLVNSQFENDEEDFYTRYVVNYSYDPVAKTYNAKKELRADIWSASIDRPLVINSKWINSDNEAETLVQRTKLRYAKTFPRVTLQTSLNKMTVDLGSLLTITDVNSGLSGKTILLTGFEKNWEDRTITFFGHDAESLFQRRGYAFWEGDSNLTNVVSGTSTAGWGTLGTVANINGTIYGSQFVWF